MTKAFTKVKCIKAYYSKGDAHCIIGQMALLKDIPIPSEDYNGNNISHSSLDKFERRLKDAYDITSDCLMTLQNANDYHSRTSLNRELFKCKVPIRVTELRRF